ncbi:MAG: hypothetical protein ABIU96_02275 [Rhodanobacter sp.]
MSFLRSISTTVALISTLLLATSVQAADVSMANGNVKFTTPDTWLSIMETQGDPEARVFQVPDPSPTGKNSLARITVTVKLAPTVNAFQQYMSDATAKSMTLPGYKVVPGVPLPNGVKYTAQESGVAADYSEQYWMKNGYAIQLRCVRPAQTEAGVTWKTAFDKGCAAIAAQLK